FRALDRHDAEIDGREGGLGRRRLPLLAVVAPAAAQALEEVAERLARIALAPVAEELAEPIAERAEVGALAVAAAAEEVVEPPARPTEELREVAPLELVHGHDVAGRAPALDVLAALELLEVGRDLVDRHGVAVLVDEEDRPVEADQLAVERDERPARVARED